MHIQPACDPKNLESSPDVRRRNLKHLLAFGLGLLLLLSGCGGDSSDSSAGDSDGDVEEALYVAYAGFDDGNDFHGLLIGDLETLASDLNDLIADKYDDAVDNSTSLPASITLSDSVIAGTSGTLTITNATAPTTLLTYSATVNLDDYGDQDLSGEVQIVGRIKLAVDDDEFSWDYCNVSGDPNVISTSSLATASAASRSYSSVTYYDWSVTIDASTSSPSYSIAGSCLLDETVAYTFAPLSYTYNADGTLAVSGLFRISEDGESLTDSLNGTVNPAWTSGTLTVVSGDAAASVTLSGSDAAFIESSSSYWTVADWRDDELAPRATDD